MDLLKSTIHIENAWCPSCRYGKTACFRYVPENGSCLHYLNISDGRRHENRTKTDSWYIKGKKYPFAFSTPEETEQIRSLYEEWGDLRLIQDDLSGNAKRIVQFYIEHGVYRLEIDK